MIDERDAEPVEDGGSSLPVSVSAVIYSRNEADLLRTSLPAITGFDEVLICDMQSTDDTVEVADRMGARVISVPHVLIAEDVRQLGLDGATSEWVLFVDADEILPPGFSAHIRSLIESDASEGIVAFRLRYDNAAFDRQLRHTLVGSAKYSLLRRSSAHYPVTGRVHQPPVFDGAVRDAPASVPSIRHLNFRTIDQTIEKTLRYSRSLPDEPQLLRPTGLVRELLRQTVFSGAWRDGTAGVVVATSIVFGRWHSALLHAERRGALTSDLPAAEQRRLRHLEGARTSLVRSRHRIGRLFGRRR